jgi:hypothetical protein
MHEEQNPASRIAANYVQPYYGSIPPVPVIAELPASPPPAPLTTTPVQQLTEDELLAHKLQNLEVEEARRRSSSLLVHQHSQPPSHAPSNPDLRRSYLEQPYQEARLHSRSVSSLAAYGSNAVARSNTQYDTSPAPYGPDPFARPHSRSVSSPLTPFGPDSFARPIGVSPSTLPEVVAGPSPVFPDSGYNPPTNHAAMSSLPEVVVSPEPVSNAGDSAIYPTAHLPPAPIDFTSLPTYLEQHRQIPYPPQWILSPSIATFYGVLVRAPRSESWLDPPSFQKWRTVRSTEHASNPTAPTFEFTVKSRGGTFRDPQLSWTMTSAGKPSERPWKYILKMNANNNIRKTELLCPPKGMDLITTYIHAPNYDSLRFIGPDGRSYLWVSHAPLTAMHGARFDTIRHALFAALPGQNNPLYGQIVADHAYWDGFVDYSEVHFGIKCVGCGASPINGLRWKCRSCSNHDICEMCRSSKTSIEPMCSFTLVNLPDEALNIRSSGVDPELVVATLQILKNWELHTMRSEKAMNPSGFRISETKARQGDLGRISHWNHTDFDKEGRWKMYEHVSGTVIKKVELAKVAAEVAQAQNPEKSAKSTNAAKDTKDLKAKRKVKHAAG